MRASRGRDPYWTVARFAGTCARCQKATPKGSRIFYYPNTRTGLCDAEPCGKQAARDLEAARFDEEMSR